MTEIKVEQGSEEWLLLRVGKLTGSNFNVLMPKKKSDIISKTAMGYIYNVVAEIFTGIDEEGFKSKWMEHGNEYEPEARKAYSIKHLTPVRECGFFTDDKFVGVSPDGIVGDNERILEIKCPKGSTHVKYMDNPEELFKAYKWQVIGEGWATEIRECTIMSYHPDFPEDKKIVEYEYTITDADIEALETRLEACIEKLLELIGEPVIDIELKEGE